MRRLSEEVTVLVQGGITMNDKEITMHILIKALETGAIPFARVATPEASKENIELICKAYKDIFIAVNNPKV